MSPKPGAPITQPAAPASAEPDQQALAQPAESLGLTKISESTTIVNAPLADSQPEVPGPAQGRRLGRPPRTTQAPVTWSVRGVSRETRAVFEQGAARAGKPLGQYLNEDVRALLEPPPGAPPAPSLEEQIQYLRRLVENLTTMLTEPGREGRESGRAGHTP